MAGLKGPERSELGQLKAAEAGPAPCKSDAGEARAATGGSKDLPGVSTALWAKDCSKGLGSSARWLP